MFNRTNYILYPYLVGTYLPIFLFAENIDQLHISSGFRAVLCTMLITSVFILLFLLISRKLYKSIVFTKLVWIIILLYIPYSYLVDTAGFSVFNSLTVFIASAILIICFSVWKLTRINFDPNLAFQIFKVILIIIYIVPTLKIGAGLISSSNKPNTISEIPKNQPKDLRDVYYIILDGHARSDLLLENYGVDNSWFTDKLKERGFIIGDKSTSNYPQTYLSVASALNMNYVNYLAVEERINSNDRSPLSKLIRDNEVFRQLKSYGYFIKIYQSGWSGIDEISTADEVLKPKGAINEYEQVLINMTPIAPLINNSLLYKSHINRILFAVEHLKTIPKDPRPTFTYLHLISPHPPFVFNSNGEIREHKYPYALNDPTWKLQQGRSKEEYIKSYSEQINFIDSKILSSIIEILRVSDTQPIIIIQSDHGPASEYVSDNPSELGLQERFSILNAYYFPENENNKFFYNSISPINSYRMMFNLYFGTDYKLLPDYAYYSPFEFPYQFKDVTASVHKLELNAK